MLLTLVAATANAQIEKGKIQLTGNFGYTRNETGGNETNVFTIVPQAGLFLSDKTSLGVILGYQSFGNSNARSTNFNYGVFGRFYKSIADRFYFFAQPQFVLGTGETAAGVDTSSFSIGVRPGFSYFVSDKISMDLTTLGFIYDKSEEGNLERSTTSFSINPATMSLGVSFIL